MTVATAAKITYTSANVDMEFFHRSFDDALQTVKSAAGQRYPLVIGGVDVPTASEPLIDVSPIDTSLVLGTFSSATADHIDRAVSAARGAQRGWARLPWEERVATLRRAAALIRERKFELAALMSVEVGKSRFESMG